MRDLDLLLLHAPSVYDFRKLSLLFGPMSDVIPSTPIFEMYPVGMTRIAAYLDEHGYHCRIKNVALKMLLNSDYNPEHFIKKQKVKLLYGIDLHWLPHAHGSLELAKIVKKYHPDKPVVFGGLSSSYFHEELIQYPQVDFVIRGDSTEIPMLMLMDALKNDGDLYSVPNLTWKKDSKVTVNKITHIPNKLHEISVNYKYIIKSVFKYRDISGHMPFRYWASYPITAIMTANGCIYNCKTCGGGAHAFEMVCKREHPVFFSPESIIKTIKTSASIIKGPIFIIGDPYQPGKKYASRLLELLKETKLKNQLILEFFTPPPRDFLKEVSESVPNVSVEISPDSHDEKIRLAYGRPYSNEKLERMISDCLEFNYTKVDIFFTIGLPHQNMQSVDDTIKYCEYLMGKFKEHSDKLFLYISPLVPYIDPGSPAFEHPEESGYKIFYKTLEEHRTALLNPSWKDMMNYETNWMTREEIVKSTYRAGEQLNQLKLKYGQLTEKRAAEIHNAIQQSIKIIERLDEIKKLPESERQKEFDKLKPIIDKLNENIICDKKELDRPFIIKGIRIPKRIQYFLTDIHIFFSRTRYFFNLFFSRSK
ncbi:TIGR04190 family B12-binding domain/radical SAM domain protein [Candidatus Desantisbacteria bacterium]|nr:TIGR04190 family B12-binding domain/radical SAM domain protein [Candidatus Desantisbacteria bacterium]